MSKKSKSQRNRHTGKVNEFKARIMRQGHITKEKGVLFLKGLVGDTGPSHSPTGVTVVRIKK